MKRPNRSYPPIRQRLPKRPPAPIAAEEKAATQTRWQRRAQWLRNHPLVVILETAGLVGLIFAVVFFFYELRERQDERTARSWQLLTTKARGNSGKAEALEYLNSSWLCLPSAAGPMIGGKCWKEQSSLQNIDLSESNHNGIVILQNANLPAIDLSYADLTNVWLDDAYLADAQMFSATIDQASFFGANMTGVDFSDTSAKGIDATEAVGLGAKFYNMDLRYSKFERANLLGVSFMHSELQNSVFTGTDLTNARFEDVDVSGSSFSGANLSGTSFRGIRYDELPDVRQIWAYRNTPPIFKRTIKENETRRQSTEKSVTRSWQEHVISNIKWRERGESYDCFRFRQNAEEFVGPPTRSQEEQIDRFRGKCSFHVFEN